MDTVAKRIKMIREMRNYTQRQLADKAEIHEVQIQMYEYGTRVPKQAQIEKLASALEIDVAFLQPSKIDTPFALYAMIYDLIQQFGDFTFNEEGTTVYIGIKAFDNFTAYQKLKSAKEAHDELSLEDFMKWLINQPNLYHNGEIIEKGNNL